MTFDDMQKLWQSLDGEQDSAAETKAFSERVQSNAIATERNASLFEFAFAGIFGAMAAITLTDAIVDREPLHSYVTALISAGIAFFVYRGRQQRLRHAGRAHMTVVEHLECGIASAEFQVRRSETFLLWFVVPSAVATAVSITFEFQGRPLWVWLIQPIALLLAYFAINTTLRNTYVPQLEAMEALRVEFASESKK